MVKARPFFPLTVVVLVWMVLSSHAFCIVTITKQPTATRNFPSVQEGAFHLKTSSNQSSSTSTTSSSCRFVTKNQKEQLDKFGATPETMGEIFFDKLTDTPDFVVNMLPDRWKDVVHGFKEMKLEKKKRQERRMLRNERSKEDETLTVLESEENDPDSTDLRP